MDGGRDGGHAQPASHRLHRAAVPTVSTTGYETFQSRLMLLPPATRGVRAGVKICFAGVSMAASCEKRRGLSDTRLAAEAMARTGAELLAASTMFSAVLVRSGSMPKRLGPGRTPGACSASEGLPPSVIKWLMVLV